MEFLPFLLLGAAVIILGALAGKPGYAVMAIAVVAMVIQAYVLMG